MTDDRNDLTPLQFLNLVLLRRRVVIGWSLAVATYAAASSLLSPRTFVSTATFVPEEGASGMPDLAATARQLGVTLQAGRGSWSPALYVEVLRSHAILKSIAADTLTVVEEGGRRVSLLDLFEIADPDPVKRLERGMRHLERRVVRVTESRTVGAVSIRVASRWASVSDAIARSLLERVNDFNVRTRQSRAQAELRFIDERLREAELELRQVEDRLQRFLQENRVIGSPQLVFERDRLQRQVTLKQETYTTLVLNREDARLRRVRDTPVITVVEAPQVAAIGEPRGTVFRTLLGGTIGGLFGLGIIILSRTLVRPGGRSGDDLSRFLELVDEVLPRRVGAWLRRALTSNG
jgi:uncharacterized protein involved in exopolysaccharide biosynthesis